MSIYPNQEILCWMCWLTVCDKKFNVYRCCPWLCIIDKHGKALLVKSLCQPPSSTVQMYWLYQHASPPLFLFFIYLCLSKDAAAVSIISHGQTFPRYISCPRLLLKWLLGRATLREQLANIKLKESASQAKKTRLVLLFQITGKRCVKLKSNKTVCLKWTSSHYLWYE